MSDERGAALGEGSIPPARYVALIADGSRRWAGSRGLSVLQGHSAGMDTALARVHDAIELGIRELTLFTFSTENWQRPADEVNGLTSLAVRHIDADTPELVRRGVQIRFLGAREGVPDAMHSRMRWAEEVSASNSAMKLFVAFNYGGRREIEDAALRFARNGGGSFRDHLYAPDMHDPDLLIRTGGDRRLSNFMLWRLAYTELVFRDEMWPAFTRRCLEQALTEFAGRRRRFGGG
jgi:undecaprenyl diphosphate synthase